MNQISSLNTPSIKKSFRKKSNRTLTIAIIPSGASHPRQWQITYRSIYYFGALMVLLVLAISFSLLHKPQIEFERQDTFENSRAWLSRWEILRRGKMQIEKNLESNRQLGESYFRELFAAEAPQIDSEIKNSSYAKNSKLAPLLSVLRFLRNREETYQSMPMGIPVNTNQITSLYGTRLDPFGLETNFHSGIDFASGTGTPIYATADGVVQSAIDEGSTGLGKHVRVIHRFGFITVYAHMDSIVVGKEQKISRGQLIGFVGMTGRTTGPHLHYEVRIKNIEPENYYEFSYNPMPFIREEL